jgi:DNA-directed RNA polymerase subunit RPC12/RpoP
VEKLICTKCGKELQMIQATAEYLGHRFSEEVPGCPECGQIYLSEELVATKIAEVESTLEQK